MTVTSYSSVTYPGTTRVHRFTATASQPSLVVLITLTGRHTGDPGSCDFQGTGFFTLATGASVNGTRCAYDFTLVSADEASTQQQGLVPQCRGRNQ